MTTLADWIRPRLPTLRFVMIGSLTWPIVMLALWFAWPAAPTIAQPLDRLTWALQLAVAPAGVLLLMVTSCMRLFGPVGCEDPFAGMESHRYKIDARVFQNTVEQAVIFVPILLGLSLRVAPQHTKILPILVGVWCVGRVLFWIGYRIKVEWRGVGFDWTALTTACGFIWFVVTLF
jgi:hypothetical protein